MIFENVKSITIPEGEVSEIWHGDTLLWKSGYTNLVPLSTEADGKTIYNGGKGYKDGYRIRSGGGEGETGSGSCIGFIPIKAGDEVRLSGWDFSHKANENAINVFDGSFTNLGQFTTLPAKYGILANAYNGQYYAAESVIQETTGVWKWVCPPNANIAFMRVSGYGSYAVNNKLGSKMIVTINEEITP